MPQVEIPDAVFERIDQVRPESQSVADFVQHAVQEKLAWEERKREFYRLSDETRMAMSNRGLSEAEILADFESFRESVSG